LFYVLLCTYGLCYFAFIIIIIIVALFAQHCYSAIFIAASVRNKLIHSCITHAQLGVVYSPFNAYISVERLWLVAC